MNGHTCVAQTKCRQFKTAQMRLSKHNNQRHTQGNQGENCRTVPIPEKKKNNQFTIRRN
jgi:hypothetical protein